VELRFGQDGAPGTLLRNVRSLAIAYLDASGVWQPSATGVLPRLIRVRIAFPPDDPRSWPDLFVAPRISGGADCTYDGRLKSCRGE
jgi:general secretion pathway protein J